MNWFSFEKSLKWAILIAGSDCLIGGEKVKTDSPYTQGKDKRQQTQATREILIIC